MYNESNLPIQGGEHWRLMESWCVACLRFFFPLALCLQSRCPSQRFCSRPHVYQLSARSELATSCAPPVSSHNRLPSPVIFTDITSIIESMNCTYVRVREWRRLTTERSRLKVGGKEIKEDKFATKEGEKKKVKGEGRAQKLKNEVFSSAWETFIHRLGRN